MNSGGSGERHPFQLLYAPIVSDIMPSSTNQPNESYLWQGNKVNRYSNLSIFNGLRSTIRHRVPYSSSSFTSPRAALAFSIIFSCNCPGTVS
jgi:hypothetical protein